MSLFHCNMLQRYNTSLCNLGVVDAVFVTHPLHSPGREHFAFWLHAKLFEVRIILFEPAPKGRATHSCSVCEVRFVCAFHSFLFLTTNYRLQLSVVRCPLSFSLQIYEKILTFTSLLLFIFSDCFSAFQRLGKMSYLCAGFRNPSRVCSRRLAV